MTPVSVRATNTMYLILPENNVQVLRELICLLLINVYVYLSFCPMMNLTILKFSCYCGLAIKYFTTEHQKKKKDIAVHQ